MKHGNCPAYLNSLVPSQVSQTTSYTLRNLTDIRTISCRTSLYEQSFLPSTIKLWNELPPDIRELRSAGAFKHYLDRDRQTPPKYYNFGSRMGQIYHTRPRLICSALKHHLFLKNVINSPLCSCGEVESTTHDLLYCPNYTIIRNKMINSISVITFPTLKLLLYGEENLSLEENIAIFKEVQTFILQSKRFSMETN